MDIKNMASPIPTTGTGGAGEIPKSSVTPGLGAPGGASFEDSLSDILSGKLQGPQAKINGQSVTEGLKFSNHAIERMRDRGISVRPEDMSKLNDAVDKAAKKGSRETLVLMGDTALIVSVKNKTIVTAMDRESMKDKVFSNIDSTVIL